MYGLVLEGGGAKGAYHIGALKAIKELGLEIDAVAGTSIGAMNGAMFVQDEIDIAYDYWYNISTEKVLDINDKYLNELLNLSINPNNLSYFINKAKEVLHNRGLDNSYFKELLKQNIKEEKLRSSKIKFALITLSLSDLKPLELFLEDIPEGKVIDYIMASAYLPAFKLQRIDGKILVDGGFYENLPVNTLLDAGYKKIIAIRTYDLGGVEEQFEDDKEIIFINPNESLGRILNFDQKNARRNIKMGYYDTLKYFKGYAGKNYYLNIKKDEKYFLKYLLSLDEDLSKNILKQFSLPETPWRRSFLENFIPKLLNLLEINYKAEYSEILINLLEILAEEFGVEKYRIYDFESLLKTVRDNYSINKREGLSKKLPAFIKTSNLLPKQVKKELLLDIAEKLFLKTGGNTENE